jgi:hypothetical protein
MNGRSGINKRKEGAKKRLEEQLKRDSKPEKVNGKTTKKLIPLSDSDKIRIKNEIEILSKIKKKIEI